MRATQEIQQACVHNKNKSGSKYRRREQPLRAGHIRLESKSDDDSEQDYSHLDDEREKIICALESLLV
jgi:hypothetical protein